MYTNYTPIHCQWVLKFENYFKNCLLRSIKAEQMHTLEASNCTLRYIANRNMCTCSVKETRRMFTAALFVIARNWKHFKCPLAVKWIMPSIFTELNIIQHED